MVTIALKLRLPKLSSSGVFREESIGGPPGQCGLVDFMRKPTAKEVMPKKSTNPRQRPTAQSAGPGEITGPAQEVLRQGGIDAQFELYARVAPELRELARRHLSATPALDLSPEKLAGLTISALAKSEDLDLRSRRQFFEFADRQAAIIVELVAQGHDPAAVPLLAVTKGVQQDAARSQVIREINGIDSDLGRVLCSRHVLDLDQDGLATISGESKASVRKRWKRANALFSTMYKEIEAREPTAPGSLDTPSSTSYPGDVPLSAQFLSTDKDPPPPGVVEELQTEIARLQTQLVIARKHIAELEARLATAGDLDIAETRTGIKALLSPPPLSEVPLCAATSFEDLWNHLKTHYSRWLSYFGADRDSISLDQIRRHDPKFIEKLTHRISRRRQRERRKLGEPKTPTLGQIMPTEVDRGDLALAGKTVGDLFEPDNRDLAVLVCGRLVRHLYGK